MFVRRDNVSIFRELKHFGWRWNFKRTAANGYAMYSTPHSLCVYFIDSLARFSWPSSTIQPPLFKHSQLWHSERKINKKIHVVLTQCQSICSLQLRVASWCFCIVLVQVFTVRICVLSLLQKKSFFSETNIYPNPSQTHMCCAEHRQQSQFSQIVCMYLSDQSRILSSFNISVGWNIKSWHKNKWKKWGRQKWYTQCEI